MMLGSFPELLTPSVWAWHQLGPGAWVHSDGPVDLAQPCSAPALLPQASASFLRILRHVTNPVQGGILLLSTLCVCVYVGGV